MSKIRGFSGHEKEKLRHKLRRKESYKKNRDRTEASNQNVYSYGRGYWIKNERREGKKICEVIPAHKESIQKITGYVEKVNYWRDKEGYTHRGFTYNSPIYSYETINIPEKMVVKRRWSEYVQIKPYLKRSHTKKKWYKRMAAKAARKTELSNGSNYKRAYDLTWALW